jgi:RNase P/RNase MRP subunit POP5
LLKRIKRRYLALEIEAVETFDSKEFMDTVWGAVTRLYGEYGASRTGLTLIDYGTKRNFAVIRASNETIDMIRAALASITRIGDKPAAVHVLGVSGTKKGLFKNIIRQRL